MRVDNEERLVLRQRLRLVDRTTQPQEYEVEIFGGRRRWLLGIACGLGFTSFAVVVSYGLWLVSRWIWG